MRPAMLVSAAAVLALGLVPGLAGGGRDPRPAAVGGVGRVGWAGLELSGVGAQLDPVALSVMALLLAVPVPVRLASRRHADGPDAGSTWRGAAAESGSARACSTPRPRTPSRWPGSSTTRCDPNATSRSPTPRSRGTSSSGCSSASGSTTSSRTGPTDPSLRLADRVGLRGPSPAERQHPPLPGLLVRRAGRRPRAGGACERRAPAVLAAAQVVAMVVLSPLLVGVMRQVRAGWRAGSAPGSCSRGATCASCCAKEPLQAAGTSWVSVGRRRSVLIVSSLLVCALTPLVGHRHVPGWCPTTCSSSCRCCCSAPSRWRWSAWTPGPRSAGMGSSRHMTIAALVEPTVLVSVYALSIPVGSSALSLIVEARLDDPASVASPVSLLALLALAIAVVAETGRLPGRQPLHPPRADHGPRGHGAGELGPRPGLARARVVAATRAHCSACSATCSCRGGSPTELSAGGLAARRRCAGRQARGRRGRSSPRSRSSSPSCGCSGSPSCWPGRSCWPSSP